MPACKRGAQAPDSTQPVAKRPRRHNHTTAPSLTDTVYNDFLSLAVSDLSRDHFIGLCAYLYTILSWGYTISAERLDAFILACSAYRVFVEQFDTEATGDTGRGVPSYHEWFSEQGLEAIENPPRTILSEHRLRSVAKENPFDFVYAEMRLEYIAEANTGVTLAREWNAALAALPAMDSTQTRKRVSTRGLRAA
ncbi:hypothetical protein AYL99_05176 [Fonsecaea erecta]|uniref:Uncharacterized protein n=1 Tax=Fonsecaea erecta TaxID=1367422 RepID=A0A178ZK57_9EURO|nr:hypothetical protein AYL99_05176 [Fonsecaea erecta]OAP60174.1 hypothetical protein AYL99_05176 [Fonsecaea erecta]